MVITVNWFDSARCQSVSMRKLSGVTIIVVVRVFNIYSLDVLIVLSGCVSNISNTNHLSCILHLACGLIDLYPNFYEMEKYMNVRR